MTRSLTVAGCGRIWLCFLIRGLFYCSFLPLWEGYDEWAHFAYIQRLVTDGKLLVDRNEAVSAEVRTSLQLAPVPWELRASAGFLTGDAWWRLRPEERAARERQLGAIPQSASRRLSAEGPPIYEALQPPLYYWLSAIPYRMMSGAPLVTRVFLLRYLSLFIASFSIPLMFASARRAELSPMIAAVVAAMPELLPDVCRVGNECLGVVIFAWLTILCLDIGRGRTSRTAALSAGIALGLGLLTKAYFLTALPAVALVYWLGFRRGGARGGLRKAAALCAITFAAALSVGGWWYVRNYVTTSTWSGLGEAVMLAHHSLRQYLSALQEVPWVRAIDAILMSHVWFGGWSSLGLRGWMYHFFFIVAGLGAAGIGLALRRSPPGRRNALYTLLAIYACFWAGQLYNVLLLFMSKGAATSMGWYMYAVVTAETMLLAAGLRAICPEPARPMVFPLLIGCLCALDLYGLNFVSIPYYTGLIAHRPDGSLASFHVAGPGWTGFSEVFGRLAANKPPWLTGHVLEAGWLCDLFATLALVGISIRWPYPEKRDAGGAEQQAQERCGLRRIAHDVH